MKAKFVFEIGVEEMPSRFLGGLEKSLQEQFASLLEQNFIQAGKIKGFCTPRRLVLLAEDLDLVQGQREEIVVGPPESIAYKDGELTKAGQGFARSQGVGVDELFVQETAKGRYLALKKVIGGQKTADLLPEICQRIIKGLPFAKKMRWEPSGLLFGRPIRWLLALLGSEIVPVVLGELEAANYTWGHRVMGPGPWLVDSAEHYLSILAGPGRVVLDRSERKKLIKEQGDALAEEQGARVIWNDALVDEVSGLVEYPKPVLGRFDSKFLELPKEVLLTSMESHQKSFGLEDEDGSLQPFFLCTLNLEPDELALVRKGWERVLRARLEDAAFFWKVDMKVPLDDWLRELDNVVFLGPLGSMGDKSRRLKKLCSVLNAELGLGLDQELPRAGELSKVDLVSEMVGEFADLQGKMGGIYALKKGEGPVVSDAIYEHYLPTGPESAIPRTKAGAALSLADKLDNLAGCFGLDMVPSGAHDPYALRRQVLGLVRIIVGHGFRLSLKKLLVAAFECYQGVNWEVEPAKAVEKLLQFIANRLVPYYVAQGFSALVVEAVLGAGFDDLYIVEKRLQALHRFSQQEDFEQAVLTFKRAANIIRKQGEQVTGKVDGRFVPDLLQEEAEQQLGKTLSEIGPEWDKLWRAERFSELFSLLRRLRPEVDNFFDQVMVMCDDQELRLNRLNLLKALVDRLLGLADFGQLQI